MRLQLSSCQTAACDWYMNSKKSLTSGWLVAFLLLLLLTWVSCHVFYPGMNHVLARYLHTRGTGQPEAEVVEAEAAIIGFFLPFISLILAAIFLFCFCGFFSQPLLGLCNKLMVCSGKTTLQSGDLNNEVVCYSNGPRLSHSQVVCYLNCI